MLPIPVIMRIKSSEPVIDNNAHVNLPYLAAIVSQENRIHKRIFVN
jgi:hypothetical protein